MHFYREIFMSRLTHFFRRFFVTEEQTLQAFALLECMRVTQLDFIVFIEIHTHDLLIVLIEKAYYRTMLKF